MTRIKVRLIASAILLTMCISCTTGGSKMRGYDANKYFEIKEADQTYIIKWYRKYKRNDNSFDESDDHYKIKGGSVHIPGYINDKPVLIDFQAFSGAELNNVTISKGVISIGDNAFTGNKLTKITIPSTVTSIGKKAFVGNKLTSVIISEGVTSIGDEAFEDNKLTAITIPSTVKSIGFNVFKDNPLTTITISSANTVYQIQNMAIMSKDGKTLFAYYGKETSYVIPDGVTTIGDYAFYKRNITSITIPASVTSIGENAFADNKLTSVNIPASVTSIGENAFADNKLTSVNIPASVTSFYTNTFINNPLAAVNVASDNKIVSSIDGVIFANQGKRLFFYPRAKGKTYIIPDGVTHIGTAAFHHANLTSVTIPTSVTIIMDYAFANNALTSVNIPPSVTTIGKAAFAMNKMTNVTISPNVKSIGDFAFLDNNLTNVIISEGVTSIGTSAFLNAFRKKTITRITIPASAKSISINDFDLDKYLELYINLYGLTAGTYEMRGKQCYYNGSVLPEPVKLITGEGVYIIKIDGEKPIRNEPANLKETSNHPSPSLKNTSIYSGTTFVRPGMHSVTVTYYKDYREIGNFFTQEVWSEGSVTFEHRYLFEGGVYEFTVKFEGKQIIFMIERK